MTEKIKFPYPLMVFDVETTGIDPVIYDICQIGAVFLDENLDIKKTYSAICRPLYASRDPEAMKIHGFTELDFKERGKNFETVAEDLNDIVVGKKYMPVAWGPGFDINFLYESFRKVKYVWPLAGRKCLDLKSIALFELLKRGKTINYKQGGGVLAVSKELGLNPIGKAHDALSDAMNEMQILKKLSGYYPC